MAAMVWSRVAVENPPATVQQEFTSAASLSPGPIQLAMAPPSVRGNISPPSPGLVSQPYRGETGDNSSSAVNGENNPGGTSSGNDTGAPAQPPSSGSDGQPEPAVYRGTN